MHLSFLWPLSEERGAVERRGAMERRGGGKRREGDGGRGWRPELETDSGVRKEQRGEPRAPSASRGEYFLGSWHHPTRSCASLISSSPSAPPSPHQLMIRVLQTEAEASKAQ